MGTRHVVAVAASCLAAGGATATTLPAVGQETPPPSEPIAVKVGDTLRVIDGDIGCVITRRDGDPVLDCRRAGSLKGTYGTLLSRERAMVARFRSNAVAQVVYTARHHGNGRRCAARPAR